MISFSEFLMTPTICKKNLPPHPLQALVVNEFQTIDPDIPRIFTFTADGNQTAIPPLSVRGEGILREFGFPYDSSAYFQNIVVLLFLSVLYACTTYVILAV